MQGRLLSLALAVALLAIAATTTTALPVAVVVDPLRPHVHLHTPGDASNAAPEQLHIALTENSGEMRFIWVVQVPFNTTGALLQGQCRVGLAAGQYVASFNATSDSYFVQGFNGTIFDAVASGLQPDTRYHYQCGDASSGFTADTAFLNAPVPGTSRTVNIINWGDMGVKDSAHSVAAITEDVNTGLYELIINAGDSSYQDDFPTPNAYICDNFYNQIQPFASKMPMMLVDGNHDTAQDYVQWLHRVRMPKPWTGDGPLSRFYWSFDYGPIHFLVFSTESGHDTAPGSEQHNFMVADLQRVNTRRNITPWVVVLTHHPAYCSDLLHYERCHPEAQQFRENYEELLFQNKVDLYVTGHNHDYERSYPVHNGTVVSKSYHNSGAPVYIVNGAAGNVEGSESFFEPGIEFRAAHGITTNKGYARWHVNMTHFDWEYFDASHKVVLDRVTLSKY
ncbi:hypothetical protein CAOG_004456 [Capsaspora owczarzaki ATCC 30864]|uniref:Purple acid phosphatase n=2 Tax=Capsaspora owczarzaki (strain ATCC 30864) TaxID=595528 RepID=A0A0D2VRX2_CAPO3|nr:hypothetical protein CAOG_004456 [Capsaspora owczarzaki ATCC 30864]